MIGIPEDIVAAAMSAYVTYPKHGEDEWMPMARALLAERDRCAALLAGQWQTIETAPHHQNVLVWREDAGEPWVAQYTDESFFDVEAGDTDRMDWFDLAGRYEGIEAPTHWMTLPSGPELLS